MNKYTVSMRTVPKLDDVNRSFWTGGASGDLLIGYCASCECWVHPPEPTCETCEGPIESRRVSGDGTVFSFTVNHHQYHPAVPPPYVIGLVELVEQPGLRLVASLVDCEPDDVAVGMPVKVHFEESGEAFVPVFAPAP